MLFLKFMNENPSLTFDGWITFPWAPLGCTSRKSSPQRLSEIHTFSPQDCCVPAVDHSLLLGDSKKTCRSTRSTRSCQPNFESDIKKEYETPGVFFFKIISPVLPNKNLHHHHHHHQNHHRHLTLIRLPLWATEPNSNFDHRSMLPPEMENFTFEVPQPFKSSNPFK